jgi:hypothetical protein
MAGQACNLWGVRLSHLWLLESPALSATDAGELPEGQARAIVPVSEMTCGDCCVEVGAAVAKIDGVVEVKEATHTSPCDPVPGRRTIVHVSAGV